jgi:hypothetical protein
MLPVDNKVLSADNIVLSAINILCYLVILQCYLFLENFAYSFFLLDDKNARLEEDGRQEEEPLDETVGRKKSGAKSTTEAKTEDMRPVKGKEADDVNSQDEAFKREKREASPALETKAEDARPAKEQEAAATANR